MLKLVTPFVIAALGLVGVAALPDCLYEAYGCVYYIWDLGNGTGEALVTCDGGGTFSFYSGAMGYCPT